MTGEGCDVRRYSVFALGGGSCTCRIVKGHQPARVSRHVNSIFALGKV